MRRAQGPGCAIESATARIEVLVRDGVGATRAHLVEEVGFGHTRRLTSLLAAALERAALAPRDLRWIAVDLGPGSFTGVRVGLATAEALALASGACLLGASSLAGLAHGAGAKHSLLVPLVPAGRRELYAGFFRADPRGRVTLLAAPRLGDPGALLEAVAEAQALLGRLPVRFVGPGAAREAHRLEEAHPGSTTPAWRAEGLSAEDLAGAALSGAGPAGGLPAREEAPVPLYVRPAQAEERVRHQALAGIPVAIRPMREEDIPAIVVLERRVFADPWTPAFFRGELAQRVAHARIAEVGGRLAGYLVASLDEGGGHLGNLAVVPEERRRGVAHALVEDLLARATAAGVDRIALEVRVSNFAAQALYRTHGFRLAGLRRGYYRESGEDALIMEWRDPRRSGRGRSTRTSHPES